MVRRGECKFCQAARFTTSASGICFGNHFSPCSMIHCRKKSICGISPLARSYRLKLAEHLALTGPNEKYLFLSSAESFGQRTPIGLISIKLYKLCNSHQILLFRGCVPSIQLHHRMESSSKNACLVLTPDKTTKEFQNKHQGSRFSNTERFKVQRNSGKPTVGYPRELIS
jgi:hypothetical protein